MIKTNEKEAKMPIIVYKIGIIGIEILNLLKRSADLKYLNGIGLEIIKKEIFTAEIAVIQQRVSKGVLKYETIQKVAREPI